MTHDPLCPQRECGACKWEGEACCRGVCQCALISQVRADTLERAAQRVEKNVLIGMTLTSKEVGMIVAAVRDKS